MVYKGTFNNCPIHYLLPLYHSADSLIPAGQKASFPCQPRSKPGYCDQMMMSSEGEGVGTCLRRKGEKTAAPASMRLLVGKG